jgi:hypothetical protein
MLDPPESPTYFCDPQYACTASGVKFTGRPTDITSPFREYEVRAVSVTFADETD